MRRIGHRGAMGHAPENTIRSFQKALDLGCDEVETDVWLMQDGRMLVSHDRPTAKTTVTLDEVLDFCRGRMAVNVELKSEKDEARARETGARVAAHLAGRRADAYISSFWWAALEAARDAAPAVRRAFVFSDAPERTALLAGARALELWALHPNRAYVTQDLVRAAHAASLKVNAWTVNDAKEITTFRNWSVDGIMSDYPERVPKE
ncbi:MAG TPA: glycerophosphodiester phosphodiesterase [Candidatus Limnocylindria bacterium]|nr:glycerophosphodiester phosphodiesterase [Candidatus Limnocylindria bacterium]